MISGKVSSGEKNYKYFIGYMNDYKIKPFSIILPKMRACVNRYDRETKWVNFFVEDDDLLKNITIYEIKLAIVLKNNFVAKPFTKKKKERKKIIKPKIKYYVD